MSKKTQAILVLDDSTLDKPYAQKMEIVTTGHQRADRNRLNPLVA